MTLSIALITHRYVCAVTDRRTSNNGIPLEEEFDKSCTLDTYDARVAISFAGLARFRNFDAHVQLLKTLEECASPDYHLNGVLQRFTERLDQLFSTHRDIRSLNPRMKLFSVQVAGYVYSSFGISVPVYGVITNFQDFDNGLIHEKPFDCFKVIACGLPPQKNSDILMIGTTSGVNIDEARRLTGSAHLLTPRAARAKLIYLLQKASRNPLSGRTVGGQCSSILIPQVRKRDGEINYHVLEPSWSDYTLATYSPNLKASSGHGTQMTFSGKTQDPRSMMRVPQVNRNKLCPCGSGLRYKFCHRSKIGKFSYQLTVSSNHIDVAFGPKKS
jgi:hypothetical protein